MKFFKMKKFVNDEAGAVTVDWVVLTAAMVVIGGSLVGAVNSGIATSGTNITNTLGDMTDTSE